MMKKVLLKISEAADMTLSELLEKIEEFQNQYPDMEIFFDGDEYAICARPKKKK